MTLRNLVDTLERHLGLIWNLAPSGSNILINRYFGLQRFQQLVRALAEQLGSFSQFLPYSMIGPKLIVPQSVFKAAWKETAAFCDFSTEAEALHDKILAIGLRGPLTITDPTVWEGLHKSLGVEVRGLAKKLMEARTDLCREASAVDFDDHHPGAYRQLMVGKAGDLLNGLLKAIERLEAAFTSEAKKTDSSPTAQPEFMDLTAVIFDLIVSFDDNQSDCRKMFESPSVDTSRVCVAPPQIPGLCGILKQHGAPRRRQGGITFAEGVRADDDNRPRHQLR